MKRVAIRTKINKIFLKIIGVTYLKNTKNSCLLAVIASGIAMSSVAWAANHSFTCSAQGLQIYLTSQRANNSDAKYYLHNIQVMNNGQQLHNGCRYPDVRYYVNPMHLHDYNVSTAIMYSQNLSAKYPGVGLKSTATTNSCTLTRHKKRPYYDCDVEISK